MLILFGLVLAAPFIDCKGVGPSGPSGPKGPGLSPGLGPSGPSITNPTGDFDLIGLIVILVLVGLFVLMSGCIIVDLLYYCNFVFNGVL